MPPEAGSARREANNASSESRSRSTAPEPPGSRGRSQGGGPRGNQGFPRDKITGVSTAHAVMRFCHSVRNFWLLSAFASMMWTLSSIFFVGKMSVLPAIFGSSFSIACFAPETGQM